MLKYTLLSSEKNGIQVALKQKVDVRPIVSVDKILENRNIDLTFGVQNLLCFLAN